MFSGYAYLHEQDYINEIITREAFARSLEKRTPKLLRNHEEDKVLGNWTEFRVDDVGLYVIGKLDMSVELARETASLMASGALNGLSLGFASLSSRKEDGKLVNTEIDLFEISVVTFPALEEALVDNMTSITMQDSLQIDDAGPHAPRRTSDGFLTANVRVARTGVQNYRGVELGRPDLDRIRVYRPPESVFDHASLRTYAHRPVTNNHPPVPVNADNWKQFAVGQVGDEVIVDGQFVRVPMVLMDSDTIKEFEAGKKQLSLGYVTDLEFKSGRTADGEEYDAVQRSIRANHLAVVAAARGGPLLRIGDDDTNSQKETTMELKSMVIDSITVQLTDTAMQVVQKALNDAAAKAATYVTDIEALKKQLSDAQTQLAGAQAEVKKTTETKDAEIDVLKKQVADSTISPAKLDQMVKDRADVVTKARLVIGDALVEEGKSSHEIRKQVVDAKMGDVAKSYSEDAVKAAFDALTSGVQQTQDTLAPALARTAVVSVSDSAKVDAAYKEHHDNLRNAWKGKAA